MRLVYSLNTDKIEIVGGVAKKTFAIYELSIRLASQFYDNIVLYTDDYGAKNLSHLPVEIIILDKKPSNEYYAWSEAKFEAISKEKGDYLHIDGDIFLSHPLILEDKDIIIENREYIWDFYYDHLFKAFNEKGVKKIFPEWGYATKTPLNIGFLKFKEDEVKELYLDRYYRLKKFFVDNFINKGIYVKGIPSLVIGQHSLDCIAEHYDYSVQVAYDNNDYAHIYGKKKYNAMYQQFINALLEKYV